MEKSTSISLHHLRQFNSDGRQQHLPAQLLQRLLVDAVGDDESTQSLIVVVEDAPLHLLLNLANGQLNCLLQPGARGDASGEEPLQHRPDWELRQLIRMHFRDISGRLSRLVMEHCLADVQHIIHQLPEATFVAQDGLSDGDDYFFDKIFSEDRHLCVG